MNFDDLCGYSREFNERNDCTVKATALAFGISYSDSHGLMRKMGRRNRCGFRYEPCLPIIAKRLDAEVECIYVREYRRGGYTANSIVRHLNPSKRYIVFVRGHVFAVINGKVEDWTEGRKHRVLKVYEVK